MADSAIEFLCPNGHKIHCSAGQAGRPARCPQCGVKFRVPRLEDIETQVDSDESAPSQQPANEQSATQQPSTRKAAVAERPRQDWSDEDEPAIEFLCPNGHRLHGPVSLKGSHGECPACGSKFRIPDADEPPSEPEPEAESKIRLGNPRTPAPEQTDPPRPVPVDSSPQPAEVARPIPVAETPGTNLRAAAVTADSPQAATIGHPLGALFSKLWSEKPSGAVVELHFGDGETLVPDYFAEALSQDDHGVFAVKEPGGTHTLSVLAWDAIVRVMVRGVGQLPAEMSP